MTNAPNNTTKRSLTRTLIQWLLAFIVFGGLGYYTGSSQHQHTPQATTGTPSKKKDKPTIWTCSMHPQIRLPKQGKCPICFMDLTPLTSDANGPKRQLTLSKAGKALAAIRTSRVERRPVFLRVHMVGQVAYDETRIKTITAWVPGRLERLFVDYTGVPVRKGDHLVRIYSPALLTAQQELLQAKRALAQARKSSSQLVQHTAQMALSSARRKLELLGLRGWQLQRILRKGKPSVRINIYAPMGGIVIHKKATEGMYVKTGSEIYTIADLSKVWVKFDAYERDLPWLHVGQNITFTTQATPGRTFRGQIVYIDPMLNPTTRTVGVRVNVDNKHKLLKPSMFVRGVVHVGLNHKGRAKAPFRKGKWVCPMHPEIIRKRRSFCTICGMRLERIATPRQQSQRDPLVIPVTAPLLTGTRAIVYVAKPNAKRPTYTGREIQLGPRAGRYYVIHKGLKEGEHVVSHGAFRLDSELQLQGRPSMMNPPPQRTTHTPKTLTRIHTSRRFVKQLSPLYRHYFALQQALAGDQPTQAHTAYRDLVTQLRKPLSPKGPSQTVWAQLRTQLYDAAKQGSQHKDIKTQRVLFEPLSKLMRKLDQQLGHAGDKPHYLAYCPMAFNNRGAAWLQRTKPIRNPYFGAKMLQCGTIKRTFDGREGQPLTTSKRFLSRLSPIYKAYLAIQHQLFRDQWPKSKRAAQTLYRLSRPSLSRYAPRKARKRWNTLQRQLIKHARQATKSKDLKTLRIHFGPLSQTLLQMVYVFGHSLPKPLFEAYCPMAFNNRGAAWVQDQDRRVHNSYFGAQMAYCGNIRRTFEARKP